MGTVVSKPKGLKITGYDEGGHTLQRIADRGLSKKDLARIVINPMFVLEQRNGGRYAYVSGQGVAVKERWNCNNCVA